MARARPDAGFALPLAVFLISVLTLMLTAVFTKLDGDRVLAHTSGATVSALAVAKGGLHSYLASREARPPDGDSLRINVTGGFVDVVANVVRKPSDTLANWLFIIRSTGHVIEPAQGADPQAVRTIAQYAQWQTGRMNLPGVFTAANGLKKKQGSIIDVRGADQSTCGAATEFTCGPATVPGIRVPQGGDPGPTGVDPPPLVGGTGREVALETNIDWVALFGGGFTPDYTLPGPAVRMDGTYSSQLITGNATLGGGLVITGTGLLIVTGDLIIQSSFSAPTTTWNGVILVGGAIDFRASTTQINGMVVSGLDKQLPAGAVPPENLGGLNLTINIWHNSCNIHESLKRLTGFAPITNGWVDNWATY